MAQKIFAWGFVGFVWLACGLQIFSSHAEIELISTKGLRFFTVDTGLAVFVLGGAHYYAQKGLLRFVDRAKVDPNEKASMMRLNRFGLLLIFLEVVAIYQISDLAFETFVL